jgi:hypothetical protein
MLKTKIYVFFLSTSKTGVAFKIVIESNSIMIYHIFNDNFKNNINFGKTKKKQKNLLFYFISLPFHDPSKKACPSNIHPKIQG